jgi:methionyl-tRNA synthetase
MSEPWKKVLYFGDGQPGPDVDRTVFLASDALRISGILLQPYMPNKSAQLLDQLGVDESRRTLEYAHPGLDLDYGVSKTEGEDEVLFDIMPHENPGW